MGARIFPDPTRLGGPDAAILAAFRDWQTAGKELRSLPEDQAGAALIDGNTAEEAACYERMDNAEIAVRRPVAKTPEGTIAKLMLALNTSACCPELERDIHNGDIDSILEWTDGADWLDQLVISAIKSLLVMGAPNG